MTRRNFKLIVLLLPLLVARSLLPVGFMWSFDEGSPRLVFCPSQGAVIPGGPLMAGDPGDAPNLRPGHEHHHDGDRQPASGSAQHGTTACPFALAAVAAPPPFVAGLITVPAAYEPGSFPHEAIAVKAIAVRAHPIRGPPALS